MRRLSVLAIGLTAACVAVVGVAPAAGAQQAPVALRAYRPVGASGDNELAGSAAPTNGPAPWWAPVASLAVPGAGQFALKQQRSVAYVVAEGFFVLQYLNARRDGNRERDAYRALAADVARRPFAGPRPVGNWDYYENLEKFLESGAFDRVPGGAVDPETDPSTFNGARWLLARETFWRDPEAPPPIASPEYQRALAFYQQSAVRDEFRWSWRDQQLAQNVYIETIRSANRSYQRAVNMLGIVAVNHLASLVDSYVTVRIRRFGGVGVGGLQVDRVDTGYLPAGDPSLGLGRWQASIRLTPAP
jgi:hypothetical protein